MRNMIDPGASEWITSGYLQRSVPDGVLYDPATIAIGSAIGGPLVSGIVGSGAASDAAGAQKEAAALSDKTQREFYNQTRADNAPFRENGLAASNKLAYLMGLTPNATGGASGAGSMSRDQLRSQLINGFSTPGTPASLGTYGEIGSNGDRSPTMGYTGGSQGTPGTVDEAGLNAAIEAQLGRQTTQNALASNGADGGSLMRRFGAGDLADDAVLNADPSYMQPMRAYNASDLKNDVTLNASPGYMQPMHKFGEADLSNDLVYQNGLKFGLDQGVQGINRQAAAGGSTLSGATLKALTRFGNDYGTTKTAGAYDRFNGEQKDQYGQRVDSFNRFNNRQDVQYQQRNDSFNRFNTDQNTQYNRLAGVAGSGQTATNQVSAAGQNAGNNISQSQQGAGNAQASGYIGQANALSGGVAQGYNNYQNQQLLNKLVPANQSGYSVGQGSAYNGTVDYGQFTPSRAGF